MRAGNKAGWSRRGRQLGRLFPSRVPRQMGGRRVGEGEFVLASECFVEDLVKVLFGVCRSVLVWLVVVVTVVVGCPIGGVNHEGNSPKFIVGGRCGKCPCVFGVVGEVCDVESLLCQLGMIAAVSYAKVLRWVVGICCSIILSNESVASAKMSGERGHPWRMPLVATKLPYEILWILIVRMLL